MARAAVHIFTFASALADQRALGSISALQDDMLPHTTRPRRRDGIPSAGKDLWFIPPPTVGAVVLSTTDVCAKSAPSRAPHATSMVLTFVRARNFFSRRVVWISAGK